MKLKKLQLLSLLGSLLLGASCSKNINLDTIKDLLNDTNPVVGPPNLASGEEWVEVPANAGGMGLDSFYVMKYEAKAMLNDESATDATGTTAATTTHKPVSTADNQPWRNINANDAAAECESLGSGYHLISNLEWTAIARDIETQDANWIGGVADSGCLMRGNATETTIGDGTGPSDSCGYNSLTDPDYGSSRDIRAKLVLSSGGEIYDLSSNLQEWTDWDEYTPGFQTGPTTCNLNWYGINNTVARACGSALTASEFGPDGTYRAGMGQFRGGTGGAAARGGNIGHVNRVGVFMLVLEHLPTYSDSTTGFRCVYRP